MSLNNISYIYALTTCYLLTMPINLKKVITQIKNLESQDSRKENKARLEETYKLFEKAKAENKKLLDKIYETESNNKAGFYFAIPDTDEEFGTIFPCDKDFRNPHIVIATDGSQINPSSHEFTPACLINTGLIAIPYFKKDIPVTLNSEPVTYSSTEELNQKGFEGIQEEDLISYERTLKEIEELVKLVKSYKAYNIPTLALLDGTLIHWHIDKFNNCFIESFIKRYSSAMEELKALNIPVISFLSNSRSNDLINMLKIYNCKFDTVDCRKNCSSYTSKDLPCNPTINYKPVFDRKLIEHYFINIKTTPGSRTSLFKSNSKILDLYNDDLKIYFFYINTGTEIARVELPKYVAKNKELLSFVQNAITLQCKVGFGYPIALSEAHHQAVVTKKDREVFYDLIRNQNVKSNQKVLISNKELRKRISFV